MKKLLAVVVTLVLVFSVMPGAVIANGAELPSMSEYDGACYTNIDTVFKEEEQNLCEIGKGLPFLSENEYTVKGEYQILELVGWLCFDARIKAFGYRIDGGEAVISEDYLREPEEAVRNAALVAGCEFAVRFRIPADVSGLKGNHVIDYLVQLADKNVYIISAQGNDMTVTYSGPEDPDATPTPKPEEVSDVVLPGIFFTFDEEDKYDDLLIGGKEVEDIGWDSEKKCEQLLVSMSDDPCITVDVGTLAYELFDEDVDLSKYKVLSIGVELDENHGSGGQIYYSTDENTGFAEERVTSISYKNKLGFQAVTANFAKIKRWSGTLLSFRYDVFGVLEKEESVVNLYYIAFFETKADADNFAKAFAEQGYDVFPVVETPTPKPTVTPSPSPTPTATPEATGAPENPTDAPDSATEAPATSEENNGCGGFVPGTLAVLAAAGIAVLMIKRKKD